jgi:hypothetical protein
MKTFVRLEQCDIEFAINGELKKIGNRMANGKGTWKLVKADQAGEKDAIAFECEIEKIPVEKEE